VFLNFLNSVKSAALLVQHLEMYNIANHNQGMFNETNPTKMAVFFKVIMDLPGCYDKLLLCLTHTTAL